MIDDVLNMSPLRREVFCTVVAFDADAPLTIDEVTEQLPARVDVARHSVDNQLRKLARQGFLEKAERETEDGSRNPVTYAPSRRGVTALVDVIELRANQVRDAKHRVERSRNVLPEGWSLVGEQEDLGGSRYAPESPFCPDCGSVWAGEGSCPDCSSQPAEDAVADGGRST